MNVLSSLASLSRWRTVSLAAVCLLGLAMAAPVLRAQEEVVPPLAGNIDKHQAGPNGAHASKTEAEAEHGVPQKSPIIGHLLWIPALPINNSMVVTWIVAAGIIGFAQYATRRIQQIPSGAQNFWEWLVESLRNFLEGVIGRQLTKKTFWFFATIFIFILATNWCGLIPGVGTVGWGHEDAEGNFHVLRPLLRGVNADLNMTLAMALIFFLLWIVWAIQANGPGGFLLHIFGPKGETKGVMKALMVVVFAIVGVLEVVSIIFRPVSLSFRLYGNIFAGENMLESMSTIYPPLAGVIPIPFYFMELLVGVVQALVFMLLTAVFTLLICSHGEEPHGEEHH